MHRVRRSGPAIASLLAGAVVLAVGARAWAACGNGVREGAEQCDGADLGGYSCADFCGNGGTLRCKADCTFDLSTCVVCGNNHKDTGEACDGTDLGGATCPQGGLLVCFTDCSQLDLTRCFACGNGRREAADACTVYALGPGCLPPPTPEQCDGGDLGGATCPTPTYHGGTPLCRTDCTLDYDTVVGSQGGCWRCGNGRVEPGEQCDGGALNGTANYGCTTTCQTRCGDGVVQGGEECDDGARNGAPGDPCSALCKVVQQYPGGGSEAVDCNIEWSIAGATPGANVSCADGDLACDQDRTVNGSCTYSISYCFNVYPGRGSNPPCTPTNVASYALWGASLSGTTALDATTQTAVLNALRATLILVPGTTVSTSGATRTVTPPLTDLNLCGSLTLSVPTSGPRDLDVKVTDSANAVDQDAMTLTCNP